MSETPAGADSGSSVDTVEKLRARVGELERRNEELERNGQHRGWRSTLRATLAIVLVILGTVFLTAAVPAIWSRNLVLNTDRYVQTMEPLASDPGVQNAVVKAVDEQFAANIDIATAVNEAFPPRAAAVLAGALQSAANSLVDTIATRFVQSDLFVKLWREINRTAHSALVAILTGNGSDSQALTVRDGILYLNLAPVITEIKGRLVAQGLSIAAKVPAVGASIKLMQLKGVTKAQSAVRLLNRLAIWLPILALLCFVGGVFAARRRRRALIISAFSISGGMLLLALGVFAGRSVYLNSLPLRYLTANDAGRVFDTLVRYLRDGLRLVFAVALLIVIIAWLTGPSRRARAFRRRVTGWARELPARGANWRYANVVAENRGVVSLSIVGLAALVLVLWTNPGGLTVLVIGLLTATLVALVYSLAPPTHVPPS